MKGKKWTGNAVALIIGLVLAFIILEIFFRLVPTQFRDYRSNIQYVPDQAAGIKLKPNQSVCAESMCYKISPIETNSVGFRDKEWSKDHYDVAVLGDSFMEAAQIADGQYASRLLEKILSVDVLNTGVSGYGTIHQWSCYNWYVSKYKPSVILLFFHTSDVSDNGCKSSRMKGVLCAEVNEKKEIAVAPLQNKLVEVKEYVRSHCRTCYVLSKLWVTVSVSIRGREKKDKDSESLQTGETVNKGWMITEHFLKKLDADISRNGGTFVVVPIPTPSFSSPEQLLAICEKNNIRTVRLDKIFSEYKSVFNLPKPYFRYRCDPHLNPLGHFLAANVVSRYLLKENLIRTQEKDERLALIEKNLQLDPMELLGKESYQQIYGGGFYTGASNILQVVGKRTFE